jgi:hypothetical protein
VIEYTPSPPFLPFPVAGGLYGAVGVMAVGGRFWFFPGYSKLSRKVDEDIHQEIWLQLELYGWLLSAVGA